MDCSCAPKLPDDSAQVSADKEKVNLVTRKFSGHPSQHPKLPLEKFSEHPWVDITKFPRRPDIYVNDDLSFEDQVTILTMLREQLKAKKDHEAKIKEGAEKERGIKMKIDVIELD